MRGLNYILPALVGIAFLSLWEFLVRFYDVPIFLLPPPSVIAVTLLQDFPSLLLSLVFTLKVTLGAFFCASVSGILLACLFAHSRLAERALMPYAIILQVTPVVAIAPLVILWVGLDNAWAALFILATLVAFFPVLSNSLLGFRSVDRGLRNLFRLYGATRWQVFFRLELPSALPFMISGMKVAGGLALIGAIVAEFVAGSGTASGLAWRIVEAGNRLNMPRMFSALFLLSATGIGLHGLLSLIEFWLLRHWHESKRRQDD
jgi:NitT/TauT family transport system permease protein